MAIAVTVAVPLLFAASSPLLAWRGPAYVLAGLAGVLAMALLLLQPLLASGVLPGFSGRRGRVAHGWTGAALVAMIIAHVAGLWITSPPDVIDALTFTSPTPFSTWGVIAMWAVFATAVLAALRRRLHPLTWRLAHMGLAVVIVAGSVVHALLIEGTMETISKTMLCVLVIAATLKVVVDGRLRAGRKR